jgi:hypothetical protein
VLRQVVGEGRAGPVAWRRAGGGGTPLEEGSRCRSPSSAAVGAPGGAWVRGRRAASFDRHGERTVVGQRR